MKSARALSVARHLGLVLATSSCGTTSSESRWQHVRVEARGGAVPETFQATLGRGPAEISTLVCPESSAPSGTERCSADGFDVSIPEAGVDVVLRATGHAFVTTSLAPDRDAVIELLHLAPFERTPDYATGFSGESCVDDLLALSLPLSTDLGQSHSVKFYVADVGGSPRVYFQDTKLHPLHFDFAATVLGVTDSATEFALATYSGANRTGMAGTLVHYPAISGAKSADGSVMDAPWTLNFFSSDDITPAQVRLAHRLIEERVGCFRWQGRERRLAYLPAGEVQERQAADDAAGFARQGIVSIAHDEFFAGLSLQALNAGVAFGTLKRLTPEALVTTPVSFRDVLLLTRLPNELPIAGGTITEEFQTPLAHVNVAARTRGTPNLAYPGASSDPEIAPLLGSLVRFEVGADDYSIRAATLDEAEEFWSLRRPERYVPSFDSAFAGVPSFQEIVFSDSIRVGVKAANLAELSRALGEHAPAKGLAVPFHYYEAHMDRSRASLALCDDATLDCVNSGRDPNACRSARDLCLPPDVEGETLSELVARVLEEPRFLADTVTRDAMLAHLRFLVERSPLDPDFSALIDARVAEVFHDAKVKLRSSTNSEDLPNFSGAGLYESYGARTTGDDTPSRVLPKVFSSVWSFRAFEERSYWNIDHRAVRMGCAINEAFSAELANGVLVTANIADPGVFGMYVNVQKGEESVTNPTGGALPEAFSIIEGPQGVQPVRQRFSSLSPGLPLLDDGEIKVLYEAATDALSHFEPLYDLGPGKLILEMEFKVTQGHEIVFKQARPYTVAPNRPSPGL
jgi:pyruvate, water dikinase